MAKSVKLKEADTFIDSSAVFDFSSKKTQEEINGLINRFDFDLRETARRPLIFTANVNTANNKTVTFSCNGRDYSDITGLIFERDSVSAIHINCDANGNFLDPKISAIVGTAAYSLSVSGKTFSMTFGPWNSCRGIIFSHSPGSISMTVN